MPAKPVAVEGMNIKVQPPVQGLVTVITPPSQIAKITDKGIYAGPLQFSVANITQAALGSVVPGALPMAVIMPTTALTTAENKQVIREGDMINGLIAVGAMHNGPAGVPIPSVITFDVKIEKAGQTLSPSD
jgi:hypothetical protein